MINTYLDDQPSTYRSALTLDSAVENQPVMQILILPSPATRDTITAQTHDATLPVTSGFEDDIAYATWEDAEWR